MRPQVSFLDVSMLEAPVPGVSGWAGVARSLRRPSCAPRPLRLKIVVAMTMLWDRNDYVASDVTPDDRYELSDGRAIYCAPTGGDGSSGTLLGGEVLSTDPAVKQAGIDAGYSPSPRNLRAPDVAIGNVPDAPGWIPGAPPLAVEYASVGQDEKALRSKIADLLRSGTRFVWVVRLTARNGGEGATSGPVRRHVEVHEAGQPVALRFPGQHLTAPGILQNPVLVEALYDREAAHEATLRNLLQRKGYASLEALRGEGREEGRDEGRLTEARSAVRRVLLRRGLSLRPEDEARIEACADIARLESWLDESVVAASAAEALK